MSNTSNCFLQEIFKVTQHKLQKLELLTCKADTNTLTVLNSFKWSFLFSTTQKVLYMLKSYFVYKFLCANGNATYVDETYEHKIKIKKDKKSNI